MDITSIVEIIVGIVIIYFFIRFIVSPILRIVAGVIAFFILIYVLQRFFGFNISEVLSHFGISFDSSKSVVDLNWIFQPIENIINQIWSFAKFALGNLPKSTNK